MIMKLTDGITQAVAAAIDAEVQRIANLEIDRAVTEANQRVERAVRERVAVAAARISRAFSIETFQDQVRITIDFKNLQEKE